MQCNTAPVGKGYGEESMGRGQDAGVKSNGLVLYSNALLVTVRGTKIQKG